VGGLCLRRNRFFLGAVFSKNLFRLKQTLLRVITQNEFVPSIRTVAGLTYKQQQNVCKYFVTNFFYSESDFCTVTSHF